MAKIKGTAVKKIISVIVTSMFKINWNISQLQIKIWASRVTLDVVFKLQFKPKWMEIGTEYWQQLQLSLKLLVRI